MLNDNNAGCARYLMCVSVWVCEDKLGNRFQCSGFRIFKHLTPET